MAFPTKSLNPGEEIVLDLNPHWIYFAEPAITVTVALIVAIFFAARFDVAVRGGVDRGALPQVVAHALRGHH